MNAPVSLKTLTLKSFRGSTATFKLIFEKERKLTLVYGENGCGKTTICDAFELLALEKIGSLENKGMGAGLDKYWPSAGQKPEDLEILLETTAGHCAGRFVNKKLTINPASGRPKIELLRRKQILDLIEAQPSKRYEAIKSFIDIDLFEQSERTLRELAKSLPGDSARAKEREGESLTTLAGFFEAAGKPSAHNPVSWAKELLKAPADQYAADIAILKKLSGVFDDLEKLWPQISDSSETAVNCATQLKDAESAVESALQASKGAGDSELLALFDAGRHYLEKHPDHASCPLCNSSEKIGGLLDRIQSGLELLAGVNQAIQTRNGAQTKVDQAKILSEGVRSEFSKKRADFAKLIEGKKWRAEMKLPEHAVPESASDLQAWLQANKPARENWSKLETDWAASDQFRKALAAAVEQFDTNVRNRMEIDALIPKVDEALKLCDAERKAFTDEVMESISGEVGKLYEMVHPGEGLNQIALPLDPKKRASIELQAKFDGKDVPPQAYFSQSHLDTLGLCVFLALAIKNGSDGTILVLDDVLGSVDEPHVERVIHMIYEVSKQFQHTIVTTHYRPWREKYRWGWLKPDQPCQFVELGPWSMDNGLKDVGSLSEVERLRTLLGATPVDTQSVCGKAGVILEAALDFLTQRYECSVTRRFGAAYTLGDLIPSVKGKLREALVIERREIGTNGAVVETKVPLKAILDEIERIVHVRNLFGAHFKAISFEMLDSDGIHFAQHVLLLMDALTHPEHGWPNNDKSGSYWRNSGDTRRMHPLKKPS
jgi:energy-coupling factor transporter ATP-binding protein EcfA2